MTFAILDNDFCSIDYFSNKVGAISLAILVWFA